MLDAVRLRPDDVETAVMATQVREAITRLREAGHHRDGDPGILLVFDAGYELTRLAFVLADLPVQVLGRMRSDRVLCFPAPPPGCTGRPPLHGPEFRFADPITWPAPETTSSTETDRYGTASASAWNRLHPKPVHRGSWAQHPGPPPRKRQRRGVRGRRRRPGQGGGVLRSHRRRRIGRIGALLPCLQQRNGHDVGKHCNDDPSRHLSQPVCPLLERKSGRGPLPGSPPRVATAPWRG